MRKHLALCALLVTPAVFGQGTTPNAAPNDNAALEQKIRDLEDRIVALEGQVRMLKSQPASAVPAGGTSTQPATAAAAPSPAPETVAQAAPQEPVHLGGAGTAAAKALNPDISMIGDFIATTGQKPSGFSAVLRFSSPLPQYAAGAERVRSFK